MTEVKELTTNEGIENFLGVNLRQLTAMCENDPVFLAKIIKLSFTQGKLVGMREAYGDMSNSLEGRTQ